MIQENDSAVQFRPKVDDDLQVTDFINTSLRLVARNDGEIYVEASQDVLKNKNYVSKSTLVNLNFEQLKELQEWTQKAIEFLESQEVDA